MHRSPQAAGAAWLLAAGMLSVATAGSLRPNAPRCDGASEGIGRPKGPVVVRCTEVVNEGKSRHVRTSRPCSMGPPGLVEVPIEASHVIERRRLKGAARLLFGLPLDLNKEAIQSFEALPGVGPSRAEVIRAARRRHHFVSVDDLRPLNGFGPRTRGIIAHCVEVTRNTGP